MLHGFVKHPIELEEVAMLEGSRPGAYIFQNSVSFVEDAGCNLACILDALSIWNDF